MKLLLPIQIICQLASADQIGFNRMRNNMYNHYTARIGHFNNHKCRFDAGRPSEEKLQKRIMMFYKQFHKQ